MTTGVFNRQIWRAGVLALAMGAAAMTTAAQAQDAPQGDDPSDEDVIAAAIGCIATYDLVLAKGAGAKTPAIRTARASAVEIYKEYSGLDDNDVQAAITKADRLFPDIVAKSGSTLKDYEQSCDDAFMDVTAAPTTTATRWRLPARGLRPLKVNLRAAAGVYPTQNP